MKKEDIISALAEAKVDITLTGEGEIRAEVLELALAGTGAKQLEDDKATLETTIETLNERIEELEKQKTPVEKADLVHRQKVKEDYRLKLKVTRFKGQLINAEILNKDQGLLEELIKSKSPVLVKEK